MPGTTAGVIVFASAPGLLNAWLDFNRNGSWADQGEQIFTNVLLVAGPNPLSFPVPAWAVPGPSFARFRFSNPCVEPVETRVAFRTPAWPPMASLC
jgi:hypothetical protein